MFTRLFAAAAFATFIGTGAALAQPQPAFTDQERQDAIVGMHDSLAVIEGAVSAEFARLGIEADTNDLTMRQLLEVQAVLNDDSLSEAEQSERIQQAIN